MKSVLISIKPKWCELITSGKKTVELRKTRPKLETPFKCLLYCTKSKTEKFYITKPPICLYTYVDDHSHNLFDEKLNGKVIGEFICDDISYILSYYIDLNIFITPKDLHTCLTDKQIIDYIGDGKQGFAWHISDLKIYDRPKELTEFRCCGGLVGIKRPPQSWCCVEENK